MHVDEKKDNITVSKVASTPYLSLSGPFMACDLPSHVKLNP